MQAECSPKLEALESLGTVLVVEDDADLRFTMADLLSERGFCVRTAINGREALVMLAELGLPDIILLDLSMPVMNGWQFLEQLRDQWPEPRPPVIVVSGEDRAIAPAATQILKKPVEFAGVLTLVREYCAIPRRQKRPMADGRAPLGRIGSFRKSVTIRT